MKKLFLQKENVYALDSPSVTENLYTVSLVIVGEDGTVLKDNNGDDLKFSNADPLPAGAQLLTFDNNKYTATFTPADDVLAQYIRAYWTAVLDEDQSVVNLNDYYPEDLVLENYLSAVSYDKQIVPVQYFIEGFLGGLDSLSQELVTVIAEINTKNKNIFKDRLLAAQVDLERDTKVKFFKEQVSLKRDLYQQEFYSEYWMQQPDWYPLVSIDGFRLLYGNQEYALSNELKDSIVMSPEGFMEFVPVSVTGNLFTLIVQTVSAIGITLVAQNERSRIPALFRILYTSGLDFPNLDPAKKASIRQAVSRRAFINTVANVDQLMRETSISQSIDGASFSRSSGLPKIIEELKKDDQQFVSAIRGEVGNLISIAVS